MAVRRKKGGYFPHPEGAPPPLVIRVKRRVGFSEVDVMGIAWYGRYPGFFEEASAELGRLCGLSYRDFADARLGTTQALLHRLIAKTNGRERRNVRDHDRFIIGWHLHRVL